MKLYYSKGVFSLAIRILIHELKLSCEYESVDLKTKLTETGQDYFKINLKGSVPALILDNNETLTENAIIQQYLADKYQAISLLPPYTDFRRYRVLEWVNYISTDIHKAGIGPLFNPNIPKEVKENVFKTILIRRLNLIESHLENKQYLFENQFTIADIYLFVILRYLDFFEISFAQFPNLRRYKLRLQERASIQHSLQEEGLRSPV